MPETPLVHATEHPGGVVGITLNDERRRNALSSEMLGLLKAGILEAERRGDRVILLSGAGPHFCAGANLGEIEGTVADAGWFRLMDELVATLRRTPLVTVACVHGACIGAGLELAASCDLRAAREDATFAIPALDMGLVYAPDLVRRLVALVGPTWTTRLLVNGAQLDASEAFVAGLVTLLTPEEPMAEALAMAGRLVSRAPQTAADTVRLIRMFSGETSLSDAWRGVHERSWRSDERLAALARVQRPGDRGVAM